METLKIKNFLCIEQAEIEIKKINLFIGSQAQGKSVIAKLIYFFKEYPNAILTAIYSKKKTKSEFKNDLIATFEKIFPKYTWQKTIFEIEYSNKYYSLSISNKKTNDDQFYFRINNDNDDKVKKIFVAAEESYKIFFSEQNELNQYYSKSEFFQNIKYDIESSLFNENEEAYTERVTYIPDSRSFFVSVQNNIFSLLNSDIQLGFFLTKFGKDYESIKNLDLTLNEKDLNNLIEKLIVGKFMIEEGQDWIISNGKKMLVRDCSSGQQEVLPIALILSKYYSYMTSIVHFIIEEPEAHLFPIAQGQIVSLISLVYNKRIQLGSVTDNIDTGERWGSPPQRQYTFTITTHSPYILTAFNNLIQAGNVAASKNHQNLDELYKVVPESEIVDFNDVSAYLVNNGTVQSILNQELKLIDANMIDEASNQFADTFEKLICMEEQHD